MKIILFDLDTRMVECWKRDFSDKDNVYILNEEFSKIMRDSGQDIDMIVSAANSFGIMDGGLDLVYRNYFGIELQEEVQKKIWERFLGEQPVGSSLIVEVPNFLGVKLCHTPTMRTPQAVDPRVVYSAMRSSLVEGHKSGARVVLIPAFAHMTGRVDAETVSTLMLRAYEDYIDSVNQDAKSERKMMNWEKVYNEKGIDDVLIGRFVFG